MTDAIAYVCTLIFSDFTPDERLRYGIMDNEPTCPQFDNSPTISATSTTDSPPILPIWTPMFTPTPLPVTDQGIVDIGSYQGEVIPFGKDVWHYKGQAGEILTVQVIADYPANTATGLRTNLLDSEVLIKSPSGNLLTQNDDKEADMTDSLIQDFSLPADGVYIIEVTSSPFITSGAYTLVISSKPRAESTAAQ